MYHLVDHPYFAWYFQTCLFSTCPFCLCVSQCDVVTPEGDSVCSRKVLHFDYHVLYSSSYGTPVLYFRVCTLGESLTFITSSSFSAPHCPSLRLSSGHACFGASSHVSDVAAQLQDGLASGAACSLYSQCYYSTNVSQTSCRHQPLNWYLKCTNSQLGASQSASEHM